MKKYMIVTLIKGEAGELQQKLLCDIASKFNVKEAIQRRPPSHITLKYSFKTDNIADVEANLQEFCDNNKSKTYKINGFDHFDENVIFMKIIPSKEMKKLYLKLIEHLKKIEWMMFKKFDGKTQFHATVAHSDIQKQFSDIWQFVQKHPANFDMKLDNLVIFQLVDGVWKVHKEFQLI